jgi:predicted O-methyltransferase YrrM
MALTSLAKIYVNQMLRHVNLRLETLTAERAEDSRLNELDKLGHFERSIFPLPFEYDAASFDEMVGEVDKHHERLADFEDAGRNEVGYSYQNPYFSSPDVEILYSLIRKHSPRTVVEVGCGNSTKIIRQAIIDGRLSTSLVSIDPEPRQEIGRLADRMYLKRVEDSDAASTFAALTEGDVLFIDSSHLVKCGNDVVFLYLNILPTIKPGVLLHIHDIFLPYEYPREWIVKEKWVWNEQYLVQTLLAFSDAFEVLWPAHYLQRTRPDFLQHFPRSKNRLAASFWLRKRK